MTDHAFAPIVRAILNETAARVSGIDPELAATLRDMASDYAGPQVSDEEWQRQTARGEHE